jgi:glycosyltransferase involved in cell wall biosynthesis
VDDGSEDETPHVDSAYANKLTYPRKQRGGPASARNAGIRASPNSSPPLTDLEE